MPKNPTSISKTALDSIQAKLSAIHAGWLHDDSNNVNTHPIHVYTRLLQTLCPNGERRQSPLINAGYAARMAVVTFVLERWIHGVVARCASSSDMTCDTINVAIIGCGMDALGIWSKFLLQHSMNKVLAQDSVESCPKIKVYEFDCWNNCILKKESLVDSGLLTASVGADCEFQANKVGNATRCQIHVRGQINIDESMPSHEESDFTLLSLDLREINDDKSILMQAALTAGLDASQPTIFISELVLAYLGYEGGNAVMHSISEMMGGNELSMFTCLEPMLPDERKEQSCDVSVEEAYAIDYGKKFSGKLHTGTSATTKPSINREHQTSWLLPLCSNKQDLQSRLTDSRSFHVPHCKSLHLS